MRRKPNSTAGWAAASSTSCWCPAAWPPTRRWIPRRVMPWTTCSRTSSPVSKRWASCDCLQFAYCESFFVLAIQVSWYPYILILWDLIRGCPSFVVVCFFLRILVRFLGCPSSFVPLSISTWPRRKSHLSKYWTNIVKIPVPLPLHSAQWQQPENTFGRSVAS